MKKRVIFSIASSAIFLACSTGNDITSNYYDDGIYFDPSYGIEAKVFEEEYLEDTNRLPDYAYSESFDYYDPNGVSAPYPDQSYYSNSGYSGYGYSYMPTIQLSFGFGNSYYNPYGYGGYGDYGYGYPGYGYPGYGYGGYPGYGYCPPPGYGYGYGNGGSNNVNTDWIGDVITGNWSDNKFRTRVNGAKPGSGRSSGGGTKGYTGPKKVAGTISSARLTQTKTNSNPERKTPVSASNVNNSSVRGEQTLSNLSNQKGSRVKSYYSSGATQKKNYTVKTVRTNNSSQVTPKQRTNTQSVKQPKKYYQSNSTPKNNSYRSKPSSGSRSSTSKPSYRIQTKSSTPSKSSNNSYKPSSGSRSSGSSGGGRSSGGSSSGGSTKSSGGGRK